MDGPQSAIDLEWDKDFAFQVSTGSEVGSRPPEILKLRLLTNLQDASRNETSPLLVRVKKALAYCRKNTKVPRPSKHHSDDHDDIRLDSMNSSSSSSSHQQTHDPRHPMRSLGRLDSSATQSNVAGPSYYDDCDPFITSPTWLKEENA
jgi:hypothetical protein